MSEISQHAFGLGAVEIRRAHRGVGTDRSDRALIRVEAALDVKRFPGTGFFVLGDTKTVFSRPT